jgi:hypothetical protein
MLTAAALSPGPPLLVPALSGTDPDAARLRAACAAAVAAVLATAPDVVAVVGADAVTQPWPAAARPDLRAYGLTEERPGVVAPLSVGLGALLLDWAGHRGGRLMWSVGPDRPDSVAAEVLAAAPRVGLLAIADGSARRTLKAPGYLDDRAEPYDAQVEQAVSTGDMAGLRRLDPDLARELMAPGWPALQVLAAVVGDDRPHATVHYVGAPFGVGYLVASLRPSGGREAS